MEIVKGLSYWYHYNVSLHLLVMLCAIWYHFYNLKKVKKNMKSVTWSVTKSVTWRVFSLQL